MPSLLLAWEKAGVRRHNPEPAVPRGSAVVVGESLHRVFWQIDIVLQTLGFLTVVLAPLNLHVCDVGAALVERGGVVVGVAFLPDGE